MIKNWECMGTMCIEILDKQKLLYSRIDNKKRQNPPTY